MNIKSLDKHTNRLKILEVRYAEAWRGLCQTSNKNEVIIIRPDFHIVKIYNITIPQLLSSIDSNKSIKRDLEYLGVVFVCDRCMSLGISDWITDARPRDTRSHGQVVNLKFYEDGIDEQILKGKLKELSVYEEFFPFDGIIYLRRPKLEYPQSSHHCKFCNGTGTMLGNDFIQDDTVSIDYLKDIK